MVVKDAVQVTFIALLLVVYITVLLAVIFILIRRSTRSTRHPHAKLIEEGYNTRFLRRSPCMKVRHQDMIPYSYEVVKTQLPLNEDESVFQNFPVSPTSLWPPPSTPKKPIHERRNLPKLYVDCYHDDEKEPRTFRKVSGTDGGFRKLSATDGGYRKISATDGGYRKISATEGSYRKISATDELKENSTNEFRKEILYKTYHDIENNELRCFDGFNEPTMSLIDENFEVTSPSKSPISSSASSSRSGSEKRRSPFHSPFKKKTHDQPFRKKSDHSSSSLKSKLKLKRSKLSRTKSNEHF